MKVKVLKTTKAASCSKGIAIKEYIQGNTYEIFDDLAQVFIEQGWGEKAEAKAVKLELKKKVIEKSPENKAVGESTDNKKETKKARSLKKKVETSKKDK
jgi:hypothetical protein